MINKFLPNQINIDPKIYAYSETHSDFKGMLKIGYTNKDVNKRIKEQYPILS